MTTFGLVHGAYHGSWCWKQLTVQLKRRGHLVLTVDLPTPPFFFFFPPFFF